MSWLPPPPDGTSVCGGFDGAERDDWAAIKLETQAGYIFTPRYGPDERPTIWRPRDWPNNLIPRREIYAAWSEIEDRYDLRRAYCDPGFHDESSFETAIEEWDLDPVTGEARDIYASFPTTSATRFYPAIRRLEADLKWITHDGCPITETHMRNARKIIAKHGRTYTLGKPSHTQKIDAAVTTVLAHEAAADERAAGWVTEPNYRAVSF